MRSGKYKNLNKYKYTNYKYTNLKLIYKFEIVMQKNIETCDQALISGHFKPVKFLLIERFHWTFDHFQLPLYDEKFSVTIFGFENEKQTFSKIEVVVSHMLLCLVNPRGRSKPQINSNS